MGAPRIVLLGRDGQVGGELQRSLLPLGEVVALGRAQADLERPDSLEAVLDALQPQSVVNAAAWTAVDRAESQPEAARRVNAESVGVLARWCARHQVPLVHYSTDYVFDGSGTRAWREDDPTGPLGVYGETKREGEARIRDSGAAHLILRTSWVFAPRGQNFLRTMLRLARERETLSVVNDQHGAPTSAELIADVTAHALLALRQGRMAGGTYHLAAAGCTDWHAYAAHVFARARARGLALRLPPEGLHAIASRDYPTPARRPMNSRLDCRRLEEALGLHLPDWTVHADRVIDFLIEEFQ